MPSANKTPPVELEISYFLLRRLLGVRTDDKKQTKVSCAQLAMVRANQ